MLVLPYLQMAITSCSRQAQQLRELLHSHGQAPLLGSSKQGASSMRQQKFQTRDLLGLKVCGSHQPSAANWVHHED
jgi:hypothetical protein